MVSCIESIVSFIGSVLSIATFFLALRFRSKVMHLREAEDFHTNRDDVVAQLEGFQSSIKKDGLNDENFRREAHSFVLELKSRYPNLGIATRFAIWKAAGELDSVKPKWNKAYSALGKLKHNLRREI